MKLRPRFLAAGAAACVTAFAFPIGIATAESSSAPSKPSAGLKDHSMGSQIRAHEGGASARSFSALDKSASKLRAGGVQGIDVSGHQGNVDWNAQWNAGKRFTWVKATEGTSYTSPSFGQQYNGSYDRGFIRGAYHFALPNKSSGATQANYFLAHGGGWTGDGKTLPGALDIEYNPYGSNCYGLSKAAMGGWIKDFSDTYHAKTGKFPAIYTSTNWWNQCVSGDFSKTNPLWVARYADSAGALPAGWSNYTVWQYSSSPIDQNAFNGSYDRLKVFATNRD